MRYQKPVVMDLSAGARARGQGPLSCVGGNGAPNHTTPCTGGLTVSGSDCYSGGSAGGYYCEAGASGADDPSGCNNGTSYIAG